MSAIDVTDEALIGAHRVAVFDAILHMMAGRARWWSPHVFVAPRGDAAAGMVGELAEIRVTRRARFIARIEEAVPPSRLRVSYVSGDFRGTGLWTFDDEASGTRIRFRWQVTPVRWWMRGFASIVRRDHSRVMKIGFRLLDAHLRGSPLKSSPSAR